MKFSLLLFAFLSFNLFAENTESFKKRFTVLKAEDGQAKAVTINFVQKKFSLMPFILQVKEDVKAEIKRLRANRGFTDTELDAFESELNDYYHQGNHFAGDPEAPRISRRAIENLKNINIEKAFKRLASKGILKEVQNKINEALFVLRLDVIANLNDSKYFFKKKVSYEVVTRLLNFAKKRLGEVPLLNLASFVIVKVHNLVLEQREFHQNMLLHYLDNFSPEELGLTHDEVNKIFSSVYESRLSPINYLEYKTIKEKWDHFGTDRFFTSVRMANKKMRVLGYGLKNKLSYNFVRVQNQIFHLLHNKHMFSPKLALAYDYDRPGKVKRFRSLLNLAQVGLGFLPINGTVKGMVDNFIESFYQAQKLSEGSLVAYFETNENQEMAEAFVKQTKNPYLIFR